MAAVKLIKLYHVAAALGMNVGCGDNSCIWGRPDGMGTNGGCDCIKDRTAFLQMQRVASQLLGEVNARRIAENTLDFELRERGHSDVADRIKKETKRP